MIENISKNDVSKRYSKLRCRIKKYVEFIRKTFEFDVSLSEISTWKKEFDELQNVPTQNEVTKDGDISQQSNGN